MITVLLITHGAMGENLLDTINTMLGELSLSAASIAVGRDDDPEERVTAAEKTIQKLGHNDGVLLLTDAFGSTPSNVANRVASTAPRRRAVAGVNLPMLVRIFNYPKLNLDDMAASAVEAGRQGVMACAHAAPNEKKKHAGT